MATMPPYPGTPRWVKVIGFAVLVAIAMDLGAHHLMGSHHGHRPHATGKRDTP